MANNLSLSNFVSISLLNTPVGLKQSNLSDIIIFTTQQFSNSDSYRVYKNPDDVAYDFGSSSEVFNQAVAIFSQTPNILNNSGNLVVAPLLTGVLNPATAGTFLTDSINASVFTSVSDGAFNITIDGAVSPTLVTGLDFTRAYTVDDIASVINSYFVSNSIEATVTVDNSKLLFTSKTTGSTSSVFITEASTGTNLLSSLYFNSENCIAIQGIDATTGQETLVNAILRLKPLIFFHGILVAYDATDSEILDAGALVQTMQKMLFVSRHELTCCDEGELFDIIRIRTYTHTRTLPYFDTAEKARLYSAGYAGRLLSVNFNGSNTTISMHAKELYGIEPDPNLTQTLEDKANRVGGDVYGNHEGVPAVYCSGANEFADNVYNDNWLIVSLQVAGFNALRKSGTKIPQTEDGVAMLVNAYRNVLEQGVRNLAIAPGTWTREVTFGDQELLKGNVATYGYYIYSTPLSQQSQADRDARKAPYVQIAIKRAGAIHSSEIMVYINN